METAVTLDTPAPLDLKRYIRSVPDFPKPGIPFCDISTLLRDAEAWQVAIARMAQALIPRRPEILAGIESRGFLLAAPLASRLGLGFTMIRKPGKLPGETVGLDYELEYGSDRLEIQSDAIRPGQRVVVLDDLLATGGTLAAAISLVRLMGGDVVSAGVVMELSFLAARARLEVPVDALVSYDA